MQYQTENFNGTFEFRCQLHNGWTINAHLHEYSEFLYCKSGSVEIVINGERIHLPEKHLVWIPANYIHQYKQTDATLICAVFSNDFIPLFSYIIQEKMIVSPVDFSDMSDILDEFHRIKKDNLMMISGYLNLICAKIIENSTFLKENQTDGVLYQKIISYISSHFQEDISLKNIAKKFGYNEKYISHSLYKLTGMHFSKLRSLYRIEYAKNLLRTKKELTISQIAYDCGFTAINTFNRVFKESTGITPREYRIISILQSHND